MASTSFVNGVTLTDAAWFNDVNDVVYDVLGDGSNVPTSIQEVRDNLSINDLTEDTAPDHSTDYIEVYDASATASRKVLLGRAMGPVLVGPTTLSSTAVNFTGIPSWVKKITIMVNDMSTNGTSIVDFRVGTSSGVVSTGYIGAAGHGSHGNNWSVSNLSSGFRFKAGTTTSAGAAEYIIGTLALADPTNFVWMFGCYNGFSSSATSGLGSGSITLSAALDRLQLTTAGGTDVFDSGTMTLLLE